MTDRVSENWVWHNPRSLKRLITCTISLSPLHTGEEDDQLIPLDFFLISLTNSLDPGNTIWKQLSYPSQTINSMNGIQSSILSKNDTLWMHHNPPNALPWEGVASSPSRSGIKDLTETSHHYPSTSFCIPLVYQSHYIEV